MELVYLWVEEYKNIKNQGFNFSPRFKCDYNPETNELTIDENDDYIENFFGENINVTAIVGKNGSGKSSLFEIALKHFADIDTKNKNICIFLINNSLKIYYSIINNNMKIEIKIPFLKYDINNTTDKKYKILKLFLDINLHILNDNNHLFRTAFRDNDIDNNNIYVIRSIDEINYDLFNFNSFKSKKYFKNIFVPNELILIFYKNKINTVNEIIGIVEDAYNKISFPYIPKMNINIFRKIIKSENIQIEFLKDEKLFTEYDRRYTPVTSMVKITFHKKEYLNKIKSFLETLTQATSELELYYEFDIKGKVNNHIFSYKYLSSGEKEIVKVLSILENLMNKDKPYNFLIFFDETFNYLHPEWQRKLIIYFIDILKNKRNKKFHLIFTTHSPFLLSDIPKQNIIFLDTDENGNCKVIDGLKDKKETFGANIHTLLSDSFFMEDGLMGEFAKSKIDEIIQFHNIVSKGRHKECLKKIYEKRKTRFWQTQSIIGEEYLKQVIKNHLVEIEKILLGKDKAKEEEIKRVEKYLESLKND